MKKLILVVVVVIVGIVLIAFQNQGSDLLGSDSTNQGGSQPAADEFSQIASLSVQGLVKNAPGKVFAIEVTNDSLSARYFQLFNLTTVTVPSRAASQSSATALKIYKASTSWASTASLVDKPLGSYLVYASRSLVFSAIIPGATASASPSIVRIDTSMFAPALDFSRGIIFGISSTFGTYASASVQSARHTVRVMFK